MIIFYVGLVCFSLVQNLFLYCENIVFVDYHIKKFCSAVLNSGYTSLLSADSFLMLHSDKSVM